MSTSVENRIVFIYADDDKDDHEFIEDAIKQSELPFDLRSVFDGLELIQVLKEWDSEQLPAFLIVDINMPKLNGFNAISYIRHNLNFDNAVFTLSTSERDEDKQRARALGVTGYYSKPDSTLRLKDILEEMTMKALKFQNK